MYYTVYIYKYILFLILSRNSNFVAIILIIYKYDTHSNIKNWPRSSATVLTSLIDSWLLTFVTGKVWLNQIEWDLTVAASRGDDFGKSLKCWFSVTSENLECNSYGFYLFIYFGLCIYLIACILSFFFFTWI